MNGRETPRPALAANSDFVRDLRGDLVSAASFFDGVPVGVDADALFLLVGVPFSLRIFLLTVTELELRRENRRMSCLGGV